MDVHGKICIKTGKKLERSHSHEQLMQDDNTYDINTYVLGWMYTDMRCCSSLMFDDSG